MKKIILHQEKSGIIAEGHPWVFPKAIKVLPRLKTGDPVEVFDEKNRYLGTGIYNEHSLYRVRLLHHHSLRAMERRSRWRVVRGS